MKILVLIFDFNKLNKVGLKCIKFIKNVENISAKNFKAWQESGLWRKLCLSIKNYALYKVFS